MPNILTISSGATCNFDADTGIVANEATTKIIQDFFATHNCVVTISNGSVSVGYRPPIYAFWLPSQAKFDLDPLLTRLTEVNKANQTQTQGNVAIMFAECLSKPNYLSFSGFSTKAIAAQQKVTNFVAENRRELIIGGLGFTAGGLAVLAATQAHKLDISKLTPPKPAFKFR